MAWADLTDSRFFYEIRGRGEPLLLIPGLGVTAQIWGPVLPELSARFSCILVDNRGVGGSQAKRQATNLRDLTSDLVELLDYLQLDRAHVLGLSLGGVIAQRLAADHPGRVDRLVLVSCTDRFTPYLRHVAALLGQTLGRMRSEAFARTVEVLGSSPDFLDASPGLIETRIRDKCAQRISPRAVGRQLRCLACADIDLERDPIRAATLVVAGEHDVLIPACYARRMADRIAGSQFLFVEGAGHNPMVERPGFVLPRVTDFLKAGGHEAAAAPHPSARSFVSGGPAQ